MLVLEGGYNLKMTARCVELCVRALLGEQPPPLPSSRAAGVAGWVSALRTVQVHQQYWQCLALSNWMDMAEAAQSSMTQVRHGAMPSQQSCGPCCWSGVMQAGGSCEIQAAMLTPACTTLQAGSSAQALGAGDEDEQVCGQASGHASI